MDINTKKFMEELQCDFRIIPTYYIEQHSRAHDPDAYLQCMVNQHLVEKDKYNFPIIATGTNDITALDGDTSPAKPSLPM